MQNGISQLPLVGCAYTKMYQAVATPGENFWTPLTPLTIDEALEQRWDTDAHYVTYYPTVLDEGEEWPRCLKVCLPKIRTLGNGSDLVTRLMVLDYDNPGHAEWTDESLQKFLQRLDALANIWPVAWLWGALHTTRHGARLIYVLDKEVPVDEAEFHHQWLCQEFNSRGLPMDSGVSDWTRMFRLPQVIRDNKKSWESPYYQQITQWQNVLPLSCLGKYDPSEGRRKDKVKHMVQVETDRPDDEQAHRLVERVNPETCKTKPTYWASEAKKRLKGRESFPILFEHAPLAEDGERNNTLFRLVNEVIRRTYSLPGTSPAHIYGLFHSAVEQLEPDNGTADWFIVLWNIIRRVWERHASKQLEKDITLQAEEERKEYDINQIAEGMRDWCQQEDLWSDDKDTVQQFVRDRMVAVTPQNTFFVMGPEGYYTPTQLSACQLIPHLRTQEISHLVDVQVPSKDGTGMVDRSLTNIVNTQSIPIHAIEAIPNLKGGYIEDIKGAARLVVPSFQLNTELEPEFIPEVDEWLHLFFGEKYSAAEQWIQWALVFEEPICALSITGSEGIGKQMLVQGLSECLVVPSLGNADDLISEYQYRLLETPFIVVDEGWPKSAFKKDPSQMFRVLTGGGEIWVNRRYMAPVKVRNPARILFTANNHDIIRELSSKAAMDARDRDALAIRILHCEADDKARNWLRMKGGVRFTGKHGRRWITGVGGQKSDYLVAKHFLYLHHQRGEKPGNRLAVEGGNCDNVMFELSTRNGIAPLVIEIIKEILNNRGNPQGLTIDGGRLYVLTSTILDYYRDNMTSLKGDGRVNPSTIGRVLSGLESKAGPKSPVKLPSRPNMGLKRWKELDVRVLQEAIERVGWSCDRLTQLYWEQKQKGIIKDEQDTTDTPTTEPVSCGESV